METSVEPRKMTTPTIKDNLKEDVLEKNEFNPASWLELQEKIEKSVNKNDKSLEEVEEPQEKIHKTQEKIDRLQEKILIFSCADKTQDKIKKLQKKIKTTQEKIDKQREKINKRQEKFDKPLEKIEEPQEKIDKQQKRTGKPQHKIDKTKNKIDKLQEKIKRTQEKIEKSIKKKEVCVQDTPCCECCDPCRYVKSETKTRRVVVPSVSSLNQSVSYNCRNCCFMLGELCKEVQRTIKGDSNVRVCEVLEELSDIILAIANDCVLFMRRIGIGTSSMLCRVVRKTQKYANAKLSKVVRYGRMAQGRS